MSLWVCPVCSERRDWLVIIASDRHPHRMFYYQDYHLLSTTQYLTRDSMFQQQNSDQLIFLTDLSSLSKWWRYELRFCPRLNVNIPQNMSIATDSTNSVMPERLVRTSVGLAMKTNSRWGQMKCHCQIKPCENGLD